MKLQDLYLYDFVGNRAAVISSTNRCDLGLSGLIVDETKNTIHLRDEKGLKVIPKQGRIFRVAFPGSTVDIYGDAIRFRPEERLKQYRRILKNLRRMVK